MRERWVKAVEEYRLPVIRSRNSGDLTYSGVTAVNETVSCP